MTSQISRRESDAASRAFVWAGWILLVLLCYGCLLWFGRNIPLTEDWLLVPALTGHAPNFWQSLWEQNNEHRVPFPRLVLLGVLRLAKGDFRAGMVLNVALLAAMAAAMIGLARKVRGGRTIYADLFFPLALLHLGNWENLFWGWQASQVIPSVLGCVVLYSMIANPALASLGAALVAGAAVVLMPLCGGNGIIFVPFFSVWLAYCAFRQWRGGTSAAPVPVVLAASALLAVTIAGLYFVGYEHPPNPPNPGVIVSLTVAAKFLALGLGPVARSSWILSTIFVALVLAPVTAVTVRRARELQGMERQRAMGLLLFVAAFALFALVVGWGRAGVITNDGWWPTRYSLMAVPALLAGFFLCTLYAPPRLKAVVPNVLLVVMLVLFPLNTAHGLWWGKWYQKSAAAVESDLRIGASSAEIVAQHQSFLHHSLDPALLAEYMVMLKSAGMGPWIALTDGPSPAPSPAPKPQIPDASQNGFVTKEFRYRRLDAATVMILWGIDGWSPVDQSQRPPGTKIRKSVMNTPMTRSGDVFVMTVRAPAGTPLLYGFLATTEDGREAWDGDYMAGTSDSGIIDAAGPEDTVRSTVPESSESAPLTTITVTYPAVVASEVFLVWGVNGWNPVPRAVRPGRTEIANSLMRTTMARNRDVFVATIDAPVGATLDYGFTLTKRRGILDFVFPIWDGPDDHPTIEAGRTVQGKRAPVLRDEFSAAARAWNWIAAGILTFIVIWAVFYKLRPSSGR